VGTFSAQVQVEEHQQTTAATQETHQKTIHALPTTTAGKQGTQRTPSSSIA